MQIGRWLGLFVLLMVIDGLALSAWVLHVVERHQAELTAMLTDPSKRILIPDELITVALAQTYRTLGGTITLLCLYMLYTAWRRRAIPFSRERFGW